MSEVPVYPAAMLGSCDSGLVSKEIDFVHHSTLGLRVIKKKKKDLALSVAHGFDFIDKVREARPDALSLVPPE